MSVFSRIPRIRSIIRFTLPKFFDLDTYIWNRYSSADAILVNIQKADEDEEHPWRRERLRQLLDKGPYKPRIYLDPTDRQQYPDEFLQDISACSHPCLHGFVLDLTGDENLHDYETVINRGELVQKRYWEVPKTMTSEFKDVSLLVDISSKSMYAIYKYNFVGARGGWSHVEELVKKATADNLLMLGWRSRPLRDHDKMIKEMSTLKDLGFVGYVLQDADQIELANKIFT